MRAFVLVRNQDVSGVSGTGIVAEGMQFTNGRCVLSWIGRLRSIGVYESMHELLLIHGHGGTTYVQWIGKEIKELLNCA